jgi:hypothetical protein
MTTNEWDRAAGMAEKHSKEGGIFVRLANDGDKVVGAFCGAPHAREVIWTGERYETFDSDVHQGKRPSLRVRVNFFVPGESAMKVIEGGASWFKDVLKVRDKYGLERWLFEIERHGEAGDPKTKYTILPEEKLSAAQLEEIATLGLHDLDDLGEGGKAAAPSPLSAQVIAELIARLKALPRAGVNAFLEELGVERIRDLKAHQELAARSCLKRIEEKLAAQTADVRPELDPFA